MFIELAKLMQQPLIDYNLELLQYTIVYTITWVSVHMLAQSSVCYMVPWYCSGMSILGPIT